MLLYGDVNTNCFCECEVCERKNTIDKKSVCVLVCLCVWKVFNAKIIFL